MNLADQKTKESVLAEQRNWVAMKEEATLLSIGSSEENGSIYPLLQNSFLEEITKNRACVLASKLAGIKGEDFMLPDRSNKYGLFVDNQGTGNVYSALVTREGLNGENEAVISVYRIGETRGTFTDHGNGELALPFPEQYVRVVVSGVGDLLLEGEQDLKMIRALMIEMVEGPPACLPVKEGAAG